MNPQTCIMVGMRQSLIEWLDRDHREYHSGLSAKSDGEVVVDALVEWLRQNWEAIEDYHDLHRRFAEGGAAQHDLLFLIDLLEGE